MRRELKNKIILRVFGLAVLGSILNLQTDGFAQAAGTSSPLDLGFRHLTIEDGLSQGMVLAIHQDRQGFMWFGTKAGLNRYDGYHFTIFRNDPFDSTSLSNNYVQAIFEDRRGRLWIGTDNGLNCFDPATEKFRRFFHDPEDPYSLGANSITAIQEAPVEDAPGMTVLWIGTSDGGLNKLVLRNDEARSWELPPAMRARNSDREPQTPNTLQRKPTTSVDHYFVRYRHQPNDAKSLSSDRIWDVLLDRANILWMATDSGLCRLDPPHTLRAGAEDGDDFTRYVHDPQQATSLLVNNCYALFETRVGERLDRARRGLTSSRVGELTSSREGALIVGTTSGVARLSPAGKAAGVFENHSYAAGIFKSKIAAAVVRICEDRRGNLWLATYQGALVVDLNRATYQWIRHHPGDPASLSYNSITALFLDHSGAVWIGTAGFGVNRWDAQAKPFLAYTSKNLGLDSGVEFSTYAMLEDRRGVTWIFANENRWFQLQRRLGKITPHPLDFVPNEVNAVHEDHEGFVWITNNLGVFRYDAPSGRIKKIFPPPDEPRLMLHAIHEDGNGDLWFGSVSPLPDNTEFLTARPLALYYWNRATAKMRAFPLPITKDFKGDRLEINRIVPDRAGNFWLSSNLGLLRFQPQSGALKIFQHEPGNRAGLTNNSVKTLLADPLQPEHFLWLGTDGGGLNRFDLVTESFSHYLEEQGLPNNVVYGLLADNAGNLWMSTNKGLSKAMLTPDTREIVKFKNYDVGDGLQSNEFNTNSYFKSGRGEMFFGGVKGFNVFHPDSIKENSFVPPVVFTDFQIRYQSVKPGQPGSPLQKTINTTATITLSPKDNVMAFEFAALDYSAPEKNLYAYKLENFEENWSRPSRDRRATYTNLKPGTYVFRVRGSNNDGVWNEVGASIKITITPPWWRTWWAYALYGAIFFGTFYGLWRYEMNRQQFKNRMELKHVEAEKLQELDRMKSRFFANISHEFRTPMTLILGPLEQMLAEEPQPNWNRFIPMMHRHGNRLLRLIRQLLDLAKLESGGAKLAADRGDLVAFLKGLVMSFDSLAVQKRIALKFSAQPAALPRYFDRDKVEKIFSNLLANAFKFTPEGGEVSVQLSVISNQLSVASNQLSVISCR